MFVTENPAFTVLFSLQKRDEFLLSLEILCIVARLLAATYFDSMIIIQNILGIPFKISCYKDKKLNIEYIFKCPGKM